MEALLLKIVNFVDKMGYFGIFIMTFVEGTLIPIPNEVTLIPAGYLVSKGDFNFWILLIVSALGNILGALTSYYVALIYGRNLLLKYGKYFFFDDQKLTKIESFFKKHGSFSVLIGRIAPGVKHFISFPAGLAKMSPIRFMIYSAIGGTIWVTILILFGMLIGNKQELISHYVEKLNYFLGFFVFFIIAFYIAFNKFKNKDKNR